MILSRPALLLLLGVSTCSLDDDAGDVAFVQQAIRATLGRNARGSAEIRALEQVLLDQPTPEEGREVVLDVLMAQPEFEEYWSLVIADLLRVRRSGGALEQEEDCWGAPLIDNDLGHAGLALVIASGDASTPYASEWNMADAVRAAVLMDDLSVAWLAYIPALAGAVGAESDEAEAAEEFQNTWLARDPACLSCHSSSFSVVDAWSGWDRHHTAPWDLESSVYAGKAGTPGGTDQTFLDAYEAGKLVYEADLLGTGLTCATCHDAGGVRGAKVQTLDPSRDGDTTSDEGSMTLAARVPVLSAEQIRAQITKGSEDINMPAYPDLEDPDLTNLVLYLQSTFGSASDVRGYFRHDTVDGLKLVNGAPAIATDVRPWGMSASCDAAIETDVDLAEGQRPAGFAGKESRTPDAFGLVGRLQDGLVALPDALASAPIQVESHLLPTVDGDVAYAYMVAGAVADALIRHATGAAPVVAHGFSRNTAQQELREDLIARMVVEENGRAKISLREGLMVLLDVNRNAPSASSLSDPWPLTMMFEPWVETDPRDTAAIPEDDADANSVGDTVHRLDGMTLLWSAAHTLGWAKPNVFLDATTFPDETLAQNIGAFQSPDKPGFDTWDMQSLLYWEEQFGDCRQDDLPAGETDWMDDLISAAQADPTGLTARDAFVTVRDRVLASPALSPDEELLIEAAVFGASSNKQIEAQTLSSLTSKGWKTLEQNLRRYCGALMISPQVTLAGIPTFEVPQEDPAADADPTTAAWSEPALLVCWQGGLNGDPELCTYEELYDHYSALVSP